MQHPSAVHKQYRNLVIVSGSPESDLAAVEELEKAGFEVTLVKEPQRVMHVGATKHKRWKPNVFVVDVVLPHSSGFEMVRRLVSKYESQEIPIIMMAQYPSPEDKLEATTAGAVGIIAKPLTSDALSHVIEQEMVRRLRSEIGDILFNLKNE